MNALLSAPVLSGLFAVGPLTDAQRSLLVSRPGSMEGIGVQHPSPVIREPLAATLGHFCHHSYQSSLITHGGECVHACVLTKLLQSCLTLCDPMDCSLLGPSVHGSLQARILEWVAMPFSRESSRPRD